MKLETENFITLKARLLKDGFLEARTIGPSMEPLIKAGVILRIKTIEPATLKFGDPIVFKRGDRLVCHIIIRKYKIHQQPNYLFITQGLNESHEDHPVESDDILGMAVNVRPTLIHLFFFIMKKNVRNFFQR